LFEFEADASQRPAIQQNRDIESTLAIERLKEQRKFGRRSVFKPAVLAFDDGHRISGTLLDMSDGGAKIKVTNPEAINGEFYLEIPSDDLIIRCRVVRTEGPIMGLQYTKPPRRLSWVRNA
jgi:hypothetical protein